MTKRWACALLVAATACSDAPVTTPAGVLTALIEEGPPRTEADEDTLASLDQILDCLQEVRGWDFEEPVVVGFYDRGQLADWILDHFFDGSSPEEFELSTRAYKALGFIPRDMDLVEVLLDTLTVQVGGFYDVYEKQLYAVSSGLGVMNKYVMIHEAGHALQDQHADLEAFVYEGETPKQDDRFLAKASVVEGGATVVTNQVLARCDDLITAEDFDAAGLGEVFVTQLVGSSGVPPVIIDGMTFPYMEGATFVQTVLDAGGWDAVNDLYRSPPRSSEQVMHPEKFLDPARADEPIPARAPDMAGFLGPGWRTVYRNGLGELGVRQLVRFTGDPGQTFRASWGWGGDEYRLYENPNGEEFFQWVTAWDSERDAVDMMVAMENVLIRQSSEQPGVKVTLNDDATVLTLHDADGTLRELARREDAWMVWFRGMRPGFPAQSMADRCLP
jgi:hypothetical protein